MIGLINWLCSVHFNCVLTPIAKCVGEPPFCCCRKLTEVISNNIVTEMTEFYHRTQLGTLKLRLGPPHTVEVCKGLRNPVEENLMEALAIVNTYEFLQS